MEQIKRPWNNIIHDYNDTKRKKLNITTIETNYLTNECISTVEDLSNELIYEIFEYLDVHHAFQAFYDLNQRFQNIFINSNLPIKINISSITKLIFQNYLTYIITPQSYRIKSFRISNPFAADMILLLYPVMTNLTRLETLIINNIESNYIEQVVDYLSCLPVLSSLTITCIDNVKNQNNIYYKIFRLPTLKYCQILCETLRRLIPLSIAKNQLSSIEHLVINHKVLISQLDSLLSYVPKLHRLSIGNLTKSGYQQRTKTVIRLNYLTNVSLKLFSVYFNDFELLITDIFSQVQVLRVAVSRYHFYNVETQYLSADRWERLISTHMPDLRIFDLEHKYLNFNYNNYNQAYQALINKFNSSFWIKRQWFFEYQYHRKKANHIAVFYSRSPYRRKEYNLYGEPAQNICSTPFDINANSVHHVYIHNTTAMKQFVDIFSNATELTLSENFDVPRYSVATSLNRIILLNQLNKLTLDCHRFHFDQIIELLQFTPNVHTLRIDSILFYGADSLSIQQNETFRIVSTTNTVTNVTISNEITLEKLQLLTVLFPRMENLTITLYEEALESIARFLLSKSNNNTRHLSLLHISKQRTNFIEKLKILIESEKLIHNCTIKFINRRLYLWW